MKNGVGNYGELAINESQAGLNNYKFSVKEWAKKTEAMSQSERLNKLNKIAIQQMKLSMDETRIKRLEGGDD